MSVATATPTTPAGLAVVFHGRTLGVEFVAPDGVGNPLETVRAQLEEAVIAGLAADPAAGRLKKLSAGLVSIRADLADARAKVATAQSELTAATESADVDAMLAARSRIASAEARVTAAAEAADMLLNPLAAAQRDVAQIAERIAFATWREQLDAAAATTERLRVKAEKAAAAHLLELAQAAGAANVLDNAGNIYDLGDIRRNAATAAVAALTRA